MNLVIDETVRRGTESFTPQALSNLIWACATLDHLRPDLLEVCTPRTPLLYR